MDGPGVGGTDLVAVESRDASTSVELSSFRHLSDEAQGLLVAVCLLQDVADTHALAFLSRQPGVPSRFQGASAEQWRAALDEAAGVGLVSPMRRGMYGLHPALPAYLAASWRQEEGEDHGAARSAATSCLIAAYAAMGGWTFNRIQEGDAGLVLRVVGPQRRTFDHLLGLALEARAWDLAHDIAEALNRYWNARGLPDEARPWVERIRQATEGPDGSRSGLDSPAGALWLFAVTSQASRQLQAHRLDEAEATCNDVRAMLEAQPPSVHQQRHVARAYHNLGMVAQGRGRLDEAEAWCRRSLETSEERRNCPGMATTCAALGLLGESASSSPRPCDGRCAA